MTTRTRVREPDLRRRTEVSPRVVLAVLWLCHFLLWTFGDMFTLLQGMGEEVTGALFLVLATTTAIVHVGMAALCVMGAVTFVRRANLIVAPLYLLLNIGFFADASQGWEYYLGTFYVVFNLLIIWIASRWRPDA